jgi:uncharacterized membrane protein (UPF0127 family)
MAGVSIALDLALFDRAGILVDLVRLEPCAAGAACVEYLATWPVAWALELPAGRVPLLEGDELHVLEPP